MKKLAKYALRLLGVGIVISLAGFAMAGFNVDNLDTRGPFESKSFSPLAEQGASAVDVVRAVELRDVNHAIEVVPSTDGEWRVDYYERGDEGYDVGVDGSGTLFARFVDKRPWYKMFSFGISTINVKLVLHVPVGTSVPMALSTINGKVNIENVNMKSLTAKTTNGPITLADIECQSDASLRTTNGAINLKRLSVNAITAHTTNGPISLDAVSAQTGEYTTTNGAVRGTLTGAPEDYTVSSRTTNGRNKLTDGGRGARTLTIRTTNGPIDVTFAG